MIESISIIIIVCFVILVLMIPIILLSVKNGKGNLALCGLFIIIGVTALIVALISSSENETIESLAVENSLKLESF